MARLDDELAEAVKAAEAVALEPAPPVSVARSPEASSKRRNLGLLLALLVSGAAVLTLVLTSLDKSAIYSRELDQVVRDKDKLAGRTLRVQGTLVSGSLLRRDEPCEYRFTIKKGDVSLPVRFPQCVVPDNFRDVPGMDVMVTAEGALSSDGHFQASNIITKCPTKYEMQERAKKGEHAPHPALGAGPATTAL